MLDIVGLNNQPLLFFMSVDNEEPSGLQSIFSTLNSDNKSFNAIIDSKHA